MPQTAPFLSFYLYIWYGERCQIFHHAIIWTMKIEIYGKYVHVDREFNEFCHLAGHNIIFDLN